MQTANVDNSWMKRGGATDQLPTGDVRSEGASCGRGRGTLFQSPLALPWEPSHFCAGYHEVGQILDRSSELQFLDHSYGPRSPSH